MTATAPASFVWSLPRHECFHACLRRYYYRYYSTAADVRPLRGLRWRHPWAAERVRRAAHALLREGRDAETAAARLLQSLRDDFRASRQHSYRSAPTSTEGLFEHEYGIAVPDGEWKGLANQAVADLQAFGRSTYVKARAGVLAVGESLRFDLRGLAVEACPDVVEKIGSDFRVHEWVQASDTASRALARAAQAWLAVARWGAAPGKVVLLEYVFPSGPANEHRLSEEAMETGREAIHDSADEMRYPLADPESDLAREEDFEVTDDERVCHACPFLKVCPKWR